MSTKASDVATELRKLADSIDGLGETEISRPFIYFSHSSGDDRKERFIALAKVLPRPLKKTYGEGSYPDLTLAYVGTHLRITASIPRSEVCEVLEPAKPAVYHCPSIFSQEEESALGPF